MCAIALAGKNVDARLLSLHHLTSCQFPWMPGQAGHDGYPVLECDRRFLNFAENVFLSYSSENRNQGELAFGNNKYPAILPLIQDALSSRA
jgi:hypothetical protein